MNIPYRPLFMYTGILENLFDPSQIITGGYVHSSKIDGAKFYFEPAFWGHQIVSLKSLG